MMQSFQSSIGMMLIRIIKLHRHFADVNLSKLGLHTGQEMILFHLYDEDGLSQTELGEKMGVEPPTITKMVQRMEANGWLERRLDTEDARVMCVYLSPHAHERKSDVVNVWERLRAHTVTYLTPGEQAILRELLAKVQKGLSEAD